MNDNKLEQQQNQQQDASGSNEKKESSRKPLLGSMNLNQDLKQALNTWDSIPSKAAKKTVKPAPPTEQMQEVKKLLTELQSKLNEFSK